MIYIAYGTIIPETAPRQYIIDIDRFFDGYFEDDWMKGEIAKRAIAEIDSSELVAPKVIESPVLGQIPYTWISGGAKIIIMMDNVQDIIYDGDNLGDNCWPLFLEIGKTKDIAINLTYYPRFEWTHGGQAVSIDTGHVIKSFEDFRDEYIRSFKNLHANRDFNSINWPIKINYNRFKLDEIDF